MPPTAGWYSGCNTGWCTGPDPGPQHMGDARALRIKGGYEYNEKKKWKMEVQERKLKGESCIKTG